ncbi:MAG: sigma-70 family RNA polymerase sigma factor [Acidobacteriota bacterium]
MAGKPPDFEQLFERYYRPVSYFFANRGFSSEESRDLAQETFLGVFKGIAGFRHDSSPETWLFTIAGNVWRNTLRSRSTAKRDGKEQSLTGLIDNGERIPETSPMAGGAPPQGPLDDALAEERMRLLRQALEELPDKMRRCLMLRLDRGLKYREIAVLMQVSIETVKSQIFQAKVRLKEKLADRATEFDGL